MQELYKCENCNEKKYFPNNFYGSRECKKCNQELIFIRKVCPFCKHSLSKRYEGLICKNWKCELDFKLGKGWVFILGRSEKNINYWEERYDFNIERFENKKKWLLKKEQILRNHNNQCAVCGKCYSLRIHHILYRSEHPLLTFDDENLIVLCEKHHKEIHNKDKWRFS